MMKSAKGHHQNHQEEEVEEDEEFGMKKDAAPSNSNPSNNTNNAKDGKNSDKANVMRSKHSVTEQKRRSKINERFQILRDLIPHSDQKRDTASFLLEVIEYVQYLQEKVQKYEGSYQPWSSEPTKLMPWRNSHWRVQSLNGSSVPPPIFPTRFDENNVAVSSNLQPTQPIQIESLDPQTELINKSIPLPIPLPIPIPSLQNDVAFSIPNQQEEPIVEGGTINISSTYSQGLLNSLTQALQTSGVDLSQATISVQINLGKQQIKELVPKDPGNQQMGHFQDMSNGEELDQTHKRMKI